jgi:hypothetical protein
MKKLLLLLCVPLIFSCGDNNEDDTINKSEELIINEQKRISVNDIRNLFSEDFKNNCITVDTIESNPFTGVIYLSHYKDRCEPFRIICHYENGLKDGMEISLGSQGRILSITNYSKGKWAGVKYDDYFSVIKTRYNDNFYNKLTSYWSRDELLKGGVIKKNTIDTPNILQFDIRRDNNGALIYQRYYNAEGKEIPKIQYDKLEYLNK